MEGRSLLGRLKKEQEMAVHKIDKKPERQLTREFPSRQRRMRIPGGLGAAPRLLLVLMRTLITEPIIILYTFMGIIYII